MSHQTTELSESAHSQSLPALSLAALGVVFGDIGTSPLYTFKTVLDVTGHSEPAAILGALSLILWTLIIVTSLKYVAIALRMDNNGEGGILALMALLRRIYGERQPLILFMGLCGAALVYGDAAITPAISVMSALEGLNIVAPHLQRYVLPATVVVLVAVFAVQKQGTARIGRLLGPVMLIWFVTIALLGLWGIVQHPAVLWALNPIVGLRYLFAGGGITTLLVVGGVFLCVTGAEALYADLGHFGRVPIRLAWSCLVFPALILNYAGQAAFVLAGAPTGGNIFYHLCPTPLLLPLVLLATTMLLDRTRWGALVRAATQDREMVGALGVNINLLYTLVFGLGAALAGLAGLMQAPILTVQIGMGENILILAFVVIIIGGIGSIRGAFIAALLVGLIDTVGRSFLPDILRLLLSGRSASAIAPAISSMLIYLLMAVVLVLRPEGLFPVSNK